MAILQGWPYCTDGSLRRRQRRRESALVVILREWPYCTGGHTAQVAGVRRRQPCRESALADTAWTRGSGRRHRGPAATHKVTRTRAHDCTQRDRASAGTGTGYVVHARACAPCHHSRGSRAQPSLPPTPALDAVQCGVVSCRVMQCWLMSYGAMRCRAVPCNAVPCCAVLCGAERGCGRKACQHARL